jgi:hypothetical protein
MPALDPNSPADLARLKEAAAAVNKKIEKTKSALPEIPFPPDSHVKLNAGVKIGETTHTDASVRELTGIHEETMARAIQTDNIFHFVDVLLQCGVEQIGDLDPGETKKALKSLLVGDRDELILAIRMATYGNDLEVNEWICPGCGKKVDIIVHLNEDDQVPHVKLERPSDAQFELKLPSGKTAYMRLSTGADQAAMYEDNTLTESEKNSILLNRVVEQISDKDGRAHVMAVEPHYILNTLGLKDRHYMLKQLVERRPGPRYNEIKFKHEECGNEVSLALGVRDLFRELFLFI